MESHLSAQKVEEILRNVSWPQEKLTEDDGRSHGKLTEINGRSPGHTES